MKESLKPIDLSNHVQQGIEHICHSVDRGQNCRPYFRFNLTNPPIWSQHEPGDTPHTVGRFLHALNLCREIAGLPNDPELLHGLRKHLFRSCKKGDGFAWDDMGYTPNPPLIFMHHQREALLGLVAIWQILEEDQAAKNHAKALVTAIDVATKENGTFPQACLGQDGWQKENLAPTTSGRLISALITYNRFFNDPLGLEIARRFARQILDDCFREDGQLTTAAGTHIHSITGTVSSLVELGLLISEKEFIDRAKLVFDVGLLPYRTQTGWVKESLNAKLGRGEANCTSDLIEAACLLGTAGYTSYFEDAERMLRNHLLASQMNDLSWVTENEEIPNTEIHAYDNLYQRAFGAFCFAEPNGFHSYNSDLTGAALQGIAVTWEHIITHKDKSVCVNLLLSKDHHIAHIDSQMPKMDCITIVPKRNVNLSVRIPPWCDYDAIAITVEGDKTPVVFRDNYLWLNNLYSGTKVQITFPQPRFLTQERALGHENTYRVQWRGNTVLAMSGSGQWMALYPKLD